MSNNSPIIGQYLRPLSAVQSLSCLEFSNARNHRSSELLKTQNEFDAKVDKQLDELFSSLLSAKAELQYMHRLKQNVLDDTIFALYQRFVELSVTLPEYKQYRKDYPLSDNTIRKADRERALQARKNESAPAGRKHQDSAHEYGKELKRIAEAFFGEACDSNDPQKIFKQIDEILDLKILRGREKLPDYETARGKLARLDGNRIRMALQKIRKKSAARHAQSDKADSTFEDRRSKGVKSKHELSILRPLLHKIGNEMVNNILGELCEQGAKVVPAINALSKSSGLTPTEGLLVAFKEQINFTIGLAEGPSECLADWRRNFESWFEKLDKATSDLLEDMENRFKGDIPNPRRHVELSQAKDANINELYQSLASATYRFSGKQLSNAILAYSFYAHEMMDKDKAAECLDKISKFSRKEVRAALVELHRERGIIEKPAYLFLRDNGGWQREVPAKENIDEAARAAELAALKQKEEEDLVAEMICEYVQDVHLARHISRGLNCELFDSVILHLQHSTSQKIAAEIIQANPYIFRAAQNKAEFSSYCHCLLLNSAKMQECYSQGKFDANKFAFPESLKDMLAQEETDKRRELVRAGLANRLRNDGFHPELTLHILDAIPYQTAINKQELAARMQPHLSGLDLSAAHLEKELQLLNAKKGLLGSASLKLNLDFIGKSAPRSSALKDAIKFTLEGKR